MKRTLVLCTSWQGPIDQTRATIDQLAQAGASKVFHTGVTDVSLARCLALSLAVEVSRRAPELQTLLLLDDDISVTLEDAQALVDACRELRNPVSGVYGTAMGKVAAQLMGGEGSLWLTGLGFFAMPLALLRAIADQLPELEHCGKRLKPFCGTGLHPKAPPGTWTSEDFWFCRELGGVYLAPIPAVHWKRLPIRAPQRTLEEVATLFPLRVSRTTEGQGG